MFQGRDGGENEEKFPFLPSLTPFLPLFCSHPNFVDELMRRLCDHEHKKLLIEVIEDRLLGLRFGSVSFADSCVKYSIL